MAEYALVGLVFVGKLVEDAFYVLLGAFLVAGTLRWRARKLNNWAIRYMDAYVVSVKAGLVGVVSFLVAISIIMAAIGPSSLAKMYDDPLFKVLQASALLFGLGAWWISHSRALMKLAGNATPITMQDAKKLTVHVFAFSFGPIVTLGLVALLASGHLSTSNQGKATEAAQPISKFQAYQLRARQAEARTSLRGIYVAEMAFYGDQKRYGTFKEIGFEMPYDHYYTYRIDGSGNPGTVIPSNKGEVTPDNAVIAAGYSATGFTVTATANIDADPSIDQWHLNDKNCCLDHADEDDVTK